MKLSEQLQGARTVAIAGHIRPDGDCVGSALATYNYIRTYYPDIEVDIYLEPIPNIFKFLRNSDKIRSEKRDDIVYDLFIVQDCGDASRLGAFLPMFRNAQRTLCIDHHVSNEGFAQVNYIYPDASSASELIFELMDESEITEEIAECIYTGIIHDTGVFKYPATSSKTMRVAGALMDKGIPFAKIVEDSFYTKTFEQNRVMGQVLLDSQLWLDGKCICAHLTRRQMEDFNVLPKHLEGIVSQMRFTKDVEVAVFMYELEDGRYKISLRSKGKVDVAEIAKSFGGGGHVEAAGMELLGDPVKLKELIVDEIKSRI